MSCDNIKSKIISSQLRRGIIAIKWSQEFHRTTFGFLVAEKKEIKLRIHHSHHSKGSSFMWSHPHEPSSPLCYTYVYIHTFFFEDRFFVVRRCNVAYYVRRGPTGSIFRPPRQRMTVDPVRNVASFPSAARNTPSSSHIHTQNQRTYTTDNTDVPSYIYIYKTHFF